MSVYTDDAGVSVVSIISSMVEVFDEDEHFELIEGSHVGHTASPSHA